MGIVIVTGLITQEHKVYSMHARGGRIAAHAQSKGDCSTWQYADRYGNDLLASDHVAQCRQWTAWRNPVSITRKDIRGILRRDTDQSEIQFIDVDQARGYLVNHGIDPAELEQIEFVQQVWNGR